MLALCASAALVLAAPQVAGAETPIKQLMGENFGGLQTILFGLISANYGAVPAQADIIRDHAEQLSGMIPKSAAEEKTQFLAYANNLSAHASDMKTISIELMKHDSERGASSTDYLREALASHYGGMVTMCVACHNRYRPLPAQ
jgi:cytochrome c556